MPFYKERQPEIVQWVEPSGFDNPSRFVVAFDDGCIYIYDKDTQGGNKEDYRKANVQMNSNSGNENDKNAPITKADLVVKMQKLVENFDFSQVYREKQGNMSIDEGKTCVFEETGEVMESIGFC